MAEAPHNRLVRRAAKEILGPMGLIQIGRSRTYELRRVAQAAAEEVRTYRACFCSIDSSEF